MSKLVFTFFFLCIKETDESMTRVDSSVPLMNYDPSDLGSLILIQITPKARTLSVSTPILPSPPPPPPALLFFKKEKKKGFF